MDFIKKNIFLHFGVPKVVTSDGGSHFTHSQFCQPLAKYGVNHKISTPYHPQTNGQAKVSNQEVKNIL
jgi:transposase InsO family protein